MTTRVEPLITATPVTASQAQSSAHTYLTSTLGPTYTTGHHYLRNGRWCFMVINQARNLPRPPVVGVVTVDATTGQVHPLTAEQIRDLHEASAVQDAQARNEVARDEQGYLLRYQARIKASVWISDRVDLKVGANDGAFLPLNPPVWRFSIALTRGDQHLDPLGVIDVDATTGQVCPLTDEQLQTIRGCVRAAKQLPALAPAA
ncbi:MAG: hypothetical protein U0350_49195 [Caldilineaceae bacterium]